MLEMGPAIIADHPLTGVGPEMVERVYPQYRPATAVNPTNPNNIIGAFQQDRWNDGGAKGLAAARSMDGGASWTRNFARFSECSGGDSDYERATDPWVSFDAAGRAYQISLSIDSAALGVSAVLASTSTDGGATWSRNSLTSASP